MPSSVSPRNRKNSLASSTSSVCRLVMTSDAFILRASLQPRYEPLIITVTACMNGDRSDRTSRSARDVNAHRSGFGVRDSNGHERRAHFGLALTVIRGMTHLIVESGYGPERALQVAVGALPLAWPRQSFRPRWVSRVR